MAVYDSPEKCSNCFGKCCRYFMLEIDTPRSKSDFENIRWFLSHRDIAIYVEKKKWLLHVGNACRHLGEQNRCEIYESRPQICREHNPSDCEYDQIYSGDRKFETLEQLDNYISKRFSRKKKKEVEPRQPVLKEEILVK